MLGVDGNHDNKEGEGRNGAITLGNMLNDHDDKYEPVTGKDGGQQVLTVWDEEAEEPLKVLVAHRPEGRGSNPTDKMSRHPGNHDVRKFGDKHQVAFYKTKDSYGSMCGSGQLPNNLTRSIADAPAPPGAVFDSVSKHPEKGVYRFEHIGVNGVNQFLYDDEEEALWGEDGNPFNIDEELDDL